jgi:lysophospholipid acyltransferase (LPLAT)-like uncharacterized protein
MTLFDRVLARIAGALAATLIRALYFTMRVRHVRVENLERMPQSIIVFWHAHLLMMVKCRFRTPISVLISQSKDGELIARTMAHFDVDSTRGSSSRGGTQAMREMLKLARMGINLVFTPDGPRGPARVANDGVVYAAQMTGLPIVPVAFAAKKKSCCGRGTAWSSRIPSPKRSSSMASPCSCRAARTSRRSACGSNGK